MNNNVLLVIVIVVIYVIVMTRASGDAVVPPDVPPDVSSDTSNTTDTSNTSDIPPHTTEETSEGFEITGKASQILAEMQSAINDVRGANGRKHGGVVEGAKACISPTVLANTLNSNELFKMRETGMYGERQLDVGYDCVEGRRNRCNASRFNNTVMCTRKLVDEASPALSPRQQLAQDSHLLYDYILPVMPQHIHQ